MMLVLSALYNTIITPIALVIEVVFCFYLKQISVGGVAGSIVAVSIAVNFLALPLYNKAETLQEAERKIQQRLAPGVKRIKDVFRSDERFMMLQTFYRENRYHPFQALRASLSILIEIPFFIAAYRFLSHCPALEGASFLFLKDLSAPDALLPLPYGRLNLLPVLMTAVNAASGAVYLRGLPLRDKVQTYVLAAVFLVLLYASPSGLVFYWLLNNLFSLAKNIVIAKCRHPARVVYAAVSCSMIAAGVYIAVFHAPHNIARRIAVALLPGLVCALPLACKLVQKKGKGDEVCAKGSFSLFLSSALGLSMLCSMVLAVNVIGTSPIEFSFIGSAASPLSYIWHCAVVFTGLFVVWSLAIYKMFEDKV